MYLFYEGACSIQAIALAFPFQNLEFILTKTITALPKTLHQNWPRKPMKGTIN